MLTSTLRQRERLIAWVRWGGVVFAAFQVLRYEAPTAALADAAEAARPVALGLVSILALAAVAAEVHLARRRSVAQMRNVGAALFAVDALVLVGLVAVYAFDPVSSQWTMLLAVPLEGAARFALVGALGGWAVSGAGYLLAIARLGEPLPASAITYRLGLVLLVAVFVGVLARDLERQRGLLAAIAGSVQDLAAEHDPAGVLTRLARAVVDDVGAAGAVAYRDTPDGLVPVAAWPPDRLAEALDGDARQVLPPARLADVRTQPRWLAADEGHPARLAVPVRLGQEPATHVLVVRPRRGHRLDPLEEEAVVRLVAAGGVALATSRLLRAEQRARRQLVTIEAIRARFVAAIAHDLRRPLTVFRGVAQLLRERREEIDPARVDELLASVERQASRLARMADDLLDAARLDVERLVLHTEPCDVAEVVASTLADVDLDVETEIDSGVTIVADRARLERIIWNLVSNAEKYGKAPVQLTAGVDDGHVELAVRDHGAGLTPEQASRVFEAFSGSEDPSSVGLGLAIVHQLAAAHGGEVSYADAEPGARFVVRLPAAGPQQTGAAPTTA